MGFVEIDSNMPLSWVDGTGIVAFYNVKKEAVLRFLLD